MMWKVTVACCLVGGVLSVSAAFFDLPSESDGESIGTHEGYRFLSFNQGTFNFLMLAKSLFGGSGICIVVPSQRGWVDSVVMRMRESIRKRTLNFIYDQVQGHPNDMTNIDPGFYNSKRATEICKYFSSYQYDGPLDGQVIGMHDQYILEDFTRGELNFVLLKGPKTCYLVPNARSSVVDFYNQASFHLKQMVFRARNTNQEDNFIPATDQYLTPQAIQECKGKPVYRMDYVSRKLD